MLLNCLKVGNIVRVSNNGERFIAIINSLPKTIPTQKELDENKHIHYNIKFSTQFNNHLSSVLQRKYLKEVDLSLRDITITLVTLDEYKEIEEDIFKPNVSSEVRAYWTMQNDSHKKLISRCIRDKVNIMATFGKRPPEKYDPNVLTINYENVMDKKAIEIKARRTQLLKNAAQKKKDPIEMYKLKQRMEKIKLNRLERRLNKFKPENKKNDKPEPKK